MARRNDITSTEKLLRVIRSRKADPLADAVPAPLPAAAAQPGEPPVASPVSPSEFETPVAPAESVDQGVPAPVAPAAAPRPKPGFFKAVLPKLAPVKKAPTAGGDQAPAAPTEPAAAETVTLVIRDVPARPQAIALPDAPPEHPGNGPGDPVAEAEPSGRSGEFGGVARPGAMDDPEALPVRPGMDSGVSAEEPPAVSGNPAEPEAVPGPETTAAPERSVLDANPDSDDDEGSEETAEPQAASPPHLPLKTGRFKMALPGIGSLRKSSTVGIDIGHDHLRLVRAVQTSGGKREILALRRFTVPKISRETPEFAAFLKASLAEVCGPSGRTDLWVNMSAAKVDVRHIRIPRVPRKQIANVVYWTVRKETPFDEKEMLLDFENQGEVMEQGIPKLSIMVYTAPRREIEELRDLFGRIGRPLTGISIVPFSVQNLFRTDWIAVPDGNIASLFIGNDFSRIDIYSGNNLVMTRGIKAGMSSMVEALVDHFSEHQGRHAPVLTIEQGRKILRSLSPDSPPLEKGDAGFGIPPEQIFEMILPALERLTRQAERTFEHYITTASGERIVRIYVTGAMNVCQPIIDYVGSQLGITSSVLDPLSEQEAAACPDLSDSRCVSERIAFGPALGLALSDNQHTPNMIFTYRDRDREASVIRINRVVFAAFIASVLICSAFFSYQNIAVAQKRAALARVETQIAQLGPPIDQNRLLQMAARVTQRRQLSRGYADRYLGMVLIGELAALTPEQVRFTDLKINLGPVRTGDAAKGPDAAKTQRVEEVTVEGLVLGERQLFETTLAAYAMALEASPLFRQVTVQKSAVEPFVKGEALHFILILKVEAQVHG